MANAPGQIELTQEVPTSTAGDQTPSAGSGNLILFPSGGLWYAKDGSGTTTLLQGVSGTRAITTATSSGLQGGGNLTADRALSLKFGNTVVNDGNSNLVEFAIPFAGLVTAASKTYVASDRGKYYQRLNGGSAMTDTLPTLGSGDNGWILKVANNGTTAAETITFTAPSGTFTGGGTTYVLNFGCRQTFVWTGSAWVFDAGNGNIIKVSPGTVPVVSGNLPSFSDTTGRNVSDSGVVAANVVKTTDTNRVTNAMLADAAQATVRGRAAGAGTGPPTDLSQTQLTALVNPATTSLSGALSALDKLKLDDVWVDATANSTAVISTAKTGTQNSAALATLYAALPNNATLYIPPGTYDMNAELTMNRDIRIRVLGAGKGRSIFRSTSTTANIFNQTVDGFYISFEELGFAASVVKTAGSAIVGASNNALLDIRRCEFDNMYRAIYLQSGAANVGVINECVFVSPSATAGGSQIKIDGAGINMMIQNCTINVTGADVIGVEINQCGAVQVGNCDFIGGRNTLLVNATNVVSALYFSNCFFDQATFGSTVKIAGTSAISRCKFLQCGITNGGGSGLVALEIAGTGTGTGIPEAIDFLLCDFYNAGFGGSTTGLLLTGVRGIDIKDCRISGFTVGIDVTSYNGAGVTNFNIQGNTIGPTENFSGNGTGIRINAGSFAYGPSNISYNDLSGNTTTALTDSGSYTSNQLQLVGNLGLSVAPKGEVPNTLIPLTTPVTRAGSGWALPANSLRVGSRLRITVGLTCAATLQILTPTLKMGTANTNADADLFVSTALQTGTAALGSMECVYEVSILSATTAMAVATFVNGANGITGVSNTPVASRGSAGPITIASITSTAFFVAPYFVSATASAVTVRSVAYEVVQQ